MAASVSDHDSESSLSESLGTKTLQARSMVRETETGQNLIWVTGKQSTVVSRY
jgi:hypothetical protein